MDVVKLEFSLTPNDYAKAVREYMVVNVGMWMVSGAFGLPLIVLFFVLFVSGQIDIQNLGRASIMLAIGLVALMYPSHFPSQAKKQALMNERFSLPRTYELGTEEIIFRSHDVESKENWGLYQSASESKNFYFLGQSKNMSHIIPKTAFMSSEVETAFRSLLISRFSIIQPLDKRIRGWTLSGLVSIVSFIFHYGIILLLRNAK